MLRLASLALACASPGAAHAAPAIQDPEATKGVTTNIEWVLPGHFEQALARAQAEQRMLLIKGISFGVDAAGATCATKGRW